MSINKSRLDAIEEGTDLYRLKTEDGVEVRKIYIKLLDPTVKVEEIEFLLSVFGPIEDIKLFGKNVNSGWKMKNRGFVTFKKASNASSALISRKRFEKLFVLKPADTWNQPEYLRVSANLSYLNPSSDQDSQLLTMLNDDCLLHVMKFLDIHTLLTAQKVCCKFNELSAIHFKTVNNLDFSSKKSKKKLTLHEAKLVMEALGPNITIATFNSENFYNQRILSFIPKYLRNLKHLHLTGFKLNSLTFWDQMRNILSSLITLDLSDNSEIEENFLKNAAKASSSLKYLNVSNCNIPGSFLDLIPNIEGLNVSGCRFIHGKQLMKFVETNKKLKSLYISKCPNIYGKDVNDMLMKIPQVRALSLNNYYIDDETSRFVIPSINPLVNLRELTIQNINFPPCDQLLRTIFLQNKIEVLNVSYGNLTLTSVYAISTMKSLKKLVMNFKNSVPEDFVDFLLELENLEEISISGCSYISPPNALKLFSLPKLWFLDISRCYGFSNDFILEVTKRLSETAPRRRFSMLVGQTDIDQNVFESTDCEKHHYLLELIWKTTRDDEHDVDYDIDEGVNRIEPVNQQEYFTIDGEKENDLERFRISKYFFRYYQHLIKH